MTVVKSYKDLIVWQKSIDLCTEVYRVTNKYPKEERFGLVDQTRRAMVSIPSNIAEGNGRSKETHEYKHFLRIAYSSAQEVETQLIIARNLKFIDKKDFEEISAKLVEILKMLNYFIYKTNN